MKVLCLSGGGARGAFQAGVIEMLASQGAKWDCVVGTSVGSLNAAGVAFLDTKQVRDIWFGIRGDGDIIGTHWLSLLWASGVYTLKPLRRLLERVLPKGRSPSIPAYFAVCDLADGRMHYVPAGIDMAYNLDNIVASCAMPSIMEPVSQTMVDGGVRDVIPLSFAVKELKADEVTVIACSPIKPLLDPWKPSFPKIVSYLGRTIEAMGLEIVQQDLELCRLKNGISPYRRVSVEVYAPNAALLSTLDFDPSKIRAAYAQGLASQPVVRFS